MTLHQNPRSLALPAASPSPPGRERWNRQRLAQGVWLVLALVLLVIFVANLPAFFQYARTVCTLPDVGNCPTEQLTPAYVQVLDQLHLSVAVARGLLSRPLCGGIRGVLAARPPDFLAQITGVDRPARLAAARAVWRNRLSRIQSARADAPAFPTPGPSHHVWADVACHVSLFSLPFPPGASPRAGHGPRSCPFSW